MQLKLVAKLISSQKEGKPEELTSKRVAQISYSSQSQQNDFRNDFLSLSFSAPLTQSFVNYSFEKEKSREYCVKLERSIINNVDVDCTALGELNGKRRTFIAVFSV